jgi:hypothetical protein
MVMVMVMVMGMVMVMVLVVQVQQAHEQHSAASAGLKMNLYYRNVKKHMKDQLMKKIQVRHGILCVQAGRTTHHTHAHCLPAHVHTSPLSSDLFWSGLGWFGLVWACGAAPLVRSGASTSSSDRMRPPSPWTWSHERFT